MTKKEKKALDDHLTYVPNAELHDTVALQCLTAMITSSPVVDRLKVDKRVWAKVAWDFADEFMVERFAR